MRGGGRGKVVIPSGGGRHRDVISGQSIALLTHDLFLFVAQLLRLPLTNASATSVSCLPPDLAFTFLHLYLHLAGSVGSCVLTPCFAL